MAKNMGYMDTAAHVNHLFIVGRTAIAFAKVRSFVIAHGGAVQGLRITEPSSRAVGHLCTVLKDMHDFIKDFDAPPPTDRFLKDACALDAKKLHTDALDIIVSLKLA
jgi:hypothetical protein